MALEAAVSQLESSLPGDFESYVLILLISVSTIILYYRSELDNLLQRSHNNCAAVLSSCF